MSRPHARAARPSTRARRAGRPDDRGSIGAGPAAGESSPGPGRCDHGSAQSKSGAISSPGFLATVSVALVNSPRTGYSGNAVSATSSPRRPSARGGCPARSDGPTH